MRFVTIITASILAGIAGVSVRRGAVLGRLPRWPLPTRFNNRRIHNGGGFEDVAPCFQLPIEQSQQAFVQPAFYEPLAKTADGRLVRHCFVGVELDELLEAQTILDLFFGLRVAQAVEMLKNHQAQKNPNTAGGASAMAVSGSNARFGFAEINFAGNGFEHAVGRAALLDGQIKKGGLFIAGGLHEFQTRFPSVLFNTFAEISFRVAFYFDVNPG